MHQITVIEPKWLSEVAPTFFRVADMNKISKRKAAEKIEPLFDRFAADKDDWVSRIVFPCIGGRAFRLILSASQQSQEAGIQLSSLHERRWRARMVVTTILGQDACVYVFFLQRFIGGEGKRSIFIRVVESDLQAFLPQKKHCAFNVIITPFQADQHMLDRVSSPRDFTKHIRPQTLFCLNCLQRTEIMSVMMPSLYEACMSAW